MLRVFVDSGHAVARHDHGAGVSVAITPATTGSARQCRWRGDADRHEASNADDRKPY
jgi:hypothetical protein